MFIQIENTPNPEVLKFLPGQPVLAGTNHKGGLEIAKGSEAGSPLGARLFGVDGVGSVFLGNDFISVTREAGHEWPALKPLVLGAIMDHFQSGAPVIDKPEGAGESGAGAAEADAGPEDKIVTQIKTLLDTRVRPAVAQDGGDIVFHGFDAGIVYLHMRGACAGCPSASMTLKIGIENLLRHYIPEVVEVRAVG